VYHIDQNLWFEDGKSASRLPHYSSVVYLCDEGGGTVVFSGRESVTVTPFPGRYLLFPGDRPHGVLFDAEREVRVRVRVRVRSSH